MNRDMRFNATKRLLMSNEVAKTGIGSKTQKNMANKNNAKTRCSIMVTSGMGRNSFGMKTTINGIVMPGSKRNCFMAFYFPLNLELSIKQPLHCNYFAKLIIVNAALCYL
jgi:hypothetical protein